MDKKELTYGDLISSPIFWADITGKIIVGAVSIAVGMLVKEGMHRLMFGPPAGGNVVPFRKHQP